MRAKPFSIGFFLATYACLIGAALVGSVLFLITGDNVISGLIPAIVGAGILLYLNTLEVQPMKVTVPHYLFIGLTTIVFAAPIGFLIYAATGMYLLSGATLGMWILNGIAPDRFW